MKLKLKKIKNRFLAFVDTENIKIQNKPSCYYCCLS